jgi:hypothetical protein
MMGHRQVEQAALFYEFSLERHVPTNHLLRSIDRFVELAELRRELSAFYSTIGRPSIAPQLMIRMLLVGPPAKPTRKTSLAKLRLGQTLKSVKRRLRHRSGQISNSTPISMICPLGIWKYAPGRWALWCMNANSSSRQRAMPDRRPLAMIVS